MYNGENNEYITRTYIVYLTLYWKGFAEWLWAHIYDHGRGVGWLFKSKREHDFDSRKSETWSVCLLLASQGLRNALPRWISSLASLP